MRRRKKAILTEAQIQEIRRKDKNYKKREKYSLKQRELFFTEYEKICKKYGCYIRSFYDAHLYKQNQDEKIYTIKSHLVSIKYGLKKCLIYRIRG